MRERGLKASCLICGPIDLCRCFAKPADVVAPDRELPTNPGLLDGVNARLDRLEYASVVDKSHIGQLQQRIAHLERQIDALLLRQVGSPSPRTRRPGEKRTGRKRT